MSPCSLTMTLAGENSSRSMRSKAWPVRCWFSATDMPRRVGESKRLPWEEVALIFHTNWRNVFESVKHAVFWGLLHRDLDRIEAIGVDEIQWQRGHHYLTLVYQIEDGMKRLLWVAQERTEQSLRGFFQFLSAESRLSIRFVCSDMWQPYLNVIAEQLKHAVHVLDRFHIMKKMNEALDDVRRSEAARLKRDGYEEVLKHSRWCLLKRPENRTEKETVKLSEPLAVQPPERSQPSPAGGFPKILGVHQPRLGREVPGSVVYPHHAEQDRANEEDRQKLA